MLACRGGPHVPEWAWSLGGEERFAVVAGAQMPPCAVASGRGLTTSVEESWLGWLRRSARVSYSELPQPLLSINAQGSDCGDGVFVGSAQGRRRRRLAAFCGASFAGLLAFKAYRGGKGGGPLFLRAPAASRSPLFIEEREAGEETPVEWVGCFTADDSGVLADGPAKYGYNSLSCATECSAFTYMVLQDGGRCVCGNSFAADPKTQQVYDGSCGSICIGDGSLTPTRYCGTSSNNAVYRLGDGDTAADVDVPPAEPDKVALVGSWLFGHERSECYIMQVQDGLQFSVPLPQGEAALGMLKDDEDGWMEAELTSGTGEQVGTIRVKLSDKQGQLISNFKYPGEQAWGKTSTARKSDIPADLTATEDTEEDDFAGLNEPVTKWQVVTKNGLNVRAMRDMTSAKLGTKWSGATVSGRRHGVWLDLDGEPGFMLIEDQGEPLLWPVADSVTSTAESTSTTVTATPTTTVTRTPTSTTTTVTPSNLPRDWIIITDNGLFVREDMDHTSAVLGTKVPGSRVRGILAGDGSWLKLTDEPGFMMTGNAGKIFLQEAAPSENGELCTQDCDTKPEMLDCLTWNPGGCEAIEDEETCLQSLDGRPQIRIRGRKVHGRPCAWCGGVPCTGTHKLCEPFDPLSPDAGGANDNSFKVARCGEEEAPLVPTVFCYVLIMASGYEAGLVRAQVSQGVGIFSCDAFTVYSNESIQLGPLRQTGPEVATDIVPGSLSVPYGGKWFTALNTGIFLRVWQIVAANALFQANDWTVKADADCVFFPDRLKDVLMTKPMRSIPMLQHGEGAAGERCGNCALPGREGTTCKKRVHSLQDDGASCESALRMAARPAPDDCDCQCGGTSCYNRTDNVGAMFLVNCRFGLHGPIEVLSREALLVFESRVMECEEFHQQPWGEDKYLDRCFQKLNIRRALTYELLDETACGEQTVRCEDASVAFHPLKDIQQHFDCWGIANANKNWPGTLLDAPAEETTGKLVIPIDRRLRRV